jgi:hypothetical protein
VQKLDRTVFRTAASQDRSDRIGLRAGLQNRYSGGIAGLEMEIQVGRQREPGVSERLRDLEDGQDGTAICCIHGFVLRRPVGAGSGLDGRRRCAIHWRRRLRLILN